MNMSKIRQALRIIAGRMAVRKHNHCIICHRAVRTFLPYRNGWAGAPPLMAALDVIGSNLDRFECPWCRSHDRERHLLMYMEKSGILAGLGDRAILHFAPEQHLSRLIKEAEPARYVKCDLHPTAPDIETIDILKIKYDKASFDLVIANHVLEHVADDLLALSEIRRVLKPGGYAILQTPFSAKLVHTWADVGIDTDCGRLQAYGQEDHVRLYGKDIFNRFASTGLIPRTCTHEQLLSEYDSGHLGVNQREPFMLFEKPKPDEPEAIGT